MNSEKYIGIECFSLLFNSVMRLYEKGYLKSDGSLIVQKSQLRYKQHYLKQSFKI
jgi:hypothetical protein